MNQMTSQFENRFSIEANRPGVIHHKFHSSHIALGRRGLERLDLLLLVIEALDLNGSQSMLWTSKKLGLQPLLPNHVEIWKYRCHNPLRRAARRGTLEPQISDALILLICSMSDRLYPRLRQLISSNEPKEKNLERWNQLYDRLNQLISQRFNQRRGAVQKLLSLEGSDVFLRQLIISLAFSSGPGGFNRLRASLLDSTS